MQSGSSPQWPRLPGFQHGLKDKLEFMRHNVAPAQLERMGIKRASLKGHLQNVSLAKALGYPDDRPGQEDNASAWVAKRINGKSRITRTELALLASYSGLAPQLGEAAQIGWILTDACSFSDFRATLTQGGWADANSLRQGPFASRDSFMTALRAYNFRLGGLRIGDEITLAAATPGPTRGARVPRADEDEKLQPIRLGAHVRLILDDMPDARHLLLLEIGPTDSSIEAFATSALVPSVLVPRTLVREGTALPRGDIAKPYFVMEGPAGRYDWLAILTSRALSPSWPSQPAELQKLNDADIRWLFDTIDALSDRDRPDTYDPMFEIRLHRFTVGIG